MAKKIDIIIDSTVRYGKPYKDKNKYRDSVVDEDILTDCDNLLKNLQPGESFEIPEGIHKRMRRLVYTYTTKRGGTGFFKVNQGRVWRLK